MGDYSGVLGPLLATVPTALQVWAKYTNAHGGLNGHPVRIVSFDTGGDPSNDATDVQQLVEQYHVLALVSDSDILDYTGSQAFIVSHGIPNVGGLNIGSAWQTYPTYFPDGTGFEQLAPIALSAVLREGHKKVGAVYCVETPLCEAVLTYVKGPNGVVAKGGGQYVYEAAASLTTPSYTAQCLGAQQAGAQVMELVLDAASITRFAQDCTTQGFTPLYETVTVGAIPSLDTVPQLTGLILPNYVFPFTDDSTPGARLFQSAMKAYSPATAIGPATAVAWAAGQTLVAGSAALGSDPSYSQLIAGLDTLKNDTLGGLTEPLTFGPTSHNPAPCVFISEIQNGQWTEPDGANPVCE